MDLHGHKINKSKKFVEGHNIYIVSKFLLLINYKRLTFQGRNLADTALVKLASLVVGQMETICENIALLL